MTEPELITVPGYITGDYCVRYKGRSLREQGIFAGDVLVVAEGADGVCFDQLVIATDEDDQARLVKFEPGLNVIGVITGVMRRIGDA